MNFKSLSKFLSYILRHHPESIGLQLDDNGWVKVSDLIQKAKKHGKPLDMGSIEKIIRNSKKLRFILNEDRKYIRAGYGHSIDIDLASHLLRPRKFYITERRGKM